MAEPPSSSDQPAAAELSLQHVLSLDSSRRHALQAVGDGTLVAAVGRTLVLYETATMSQRYITCPASIAAVAVHPDKQLLVLAGRSADGLPPSLYLYTYPELELSKALTGGTERAYSCVAFNPKGDMLAAVGAAPDYLLTLWDWANGGILLRCKAFSQEVYSVKFSPFFPGHLVTCGTGHIRFWKMATTFTGLKLQGALGKFGTVELSDIATFLELPDGKVLSGSEGGSLLLWDGGLIKVVLTRPGGAPCHAGAIELLHHDAATNYVLSGGADGVLRLWDYTKLCEAEPGEAAATAELKPAVEVALPPGAHVKGAVWLKGRWLVLDERGASHVVIPPMNLLDSRSYVVNTLPTLSWGAVQHVLPGASGAGIITGAVSGTLCLLDVSTNKVSAQRSFHAPITCLNKLPPSVDGLQRQLLVGTADGVVRLVGLCGDGWKLLAAWKPHAAAVRWAGVSPSGHCMVSIAEDATCFFFRPAAAAEAGQPSQWVPVASGRLPAAPSCCCWCGQGLEVLVGTTGGEVLAITPPALEEEDGSSRQFERPLQYSRMRLQTSSTVTVVQQPTTTAAPPAAEQPDAPVSGAEAVPAEAAAAAADAAVPSSTGAQQASGSEAAAAAGSSAAPPPAVPEVVVQTVYTDVSQRVTWIAPSPEDGTCFRACIAGPGCGKVWGYRIGVGQPLGQEELLPSSAAVTVHGISSCGRYLLSGGTGGVVRVQLLDASGSSVWTSVVHDSSTGHLTSVVMTPDSQHLVTAAQDGTLLLLAPPHPQPAAAAASSVVPLPSLAEDTGPEVADITGKEALTLQQQQAAAEAQQAAAAAVAAKAQRQAQLQQLRQELEKLMEANRSRPEGQRLPEEAFHIDQGLDQLLAAERAAALEEAAARLAWSSEAAALGAAKLRAFFLEPLAVELVAVAPFGGGPPATTLRQAALLPEVQVELERLLGGSGQDVFAEGGDQGSKAMHKQASVRKGPKAGGANKAVSIQGPAMEPSGTTVGGQGSAAGMCKGDQRRAARAAREAQWAAFNATKPDDKYEAPADVAALADAAATIGDYKLKSDPDYVLPEDQRLTPAKALQQWRAYSARVAAAQQRHNAAVLALRERKRGLLTRIGAINQRMAVLNQLLGQTGGITTWAMAPQEEPETTREQVTPQQLAEYQARKAAAAAKAAGTGAGSGGLGGFAAVAAPPAAAPAAAAPPAAARPTSRPAGAVPGGGVVSTGPLSALEQEEEEVAQLRRAAERQQLIAEVASLTASFDAELAGLRRRGLALALDLKLWEGSQLRQYQQLQLLKDFEKREVVLLAKHATKTGEIEELVGRLEGVDGELADKRAAGEVLGAKRAEVVAQFEAAVAEVAELKEALAKVFFKKIARHKKRSGGAGGEEGREEEEEEEEEEELEEDEDDGEEVCPPGCPPALYEQVRELREHRLDEEEDAAEVAKEVEGVRKEREILTKKLKLLEQSLAAINQDIHEFQKEKQAALNQVPVDVLLRLHQLEHLPAGPGALPADTSGALVFDQQQLEALRQRMQSLDEERAALKQHQAELRRQHAALQGAAAEHQAALAAARARCVDVQQLKFGGPVDVSLLDTLGVSHKGAMELRQQLHQQEVRQAAELAAWDARLQGCLADLVGLTRANTAALSAVTTLTQEQQGLETALLANQRVLYEDPLDVRRRQVAERDALVRLVNKQAAEMEAAKAALAGLRRKGGFLPPVV